MVRPSFLLLVEVYVVRSWRLTVLGECALMSLNGDVCSSSLASVVCLRRLLCLDFPAVPLAITDLVVCMEDVNRTE